MQIKLDYVTLDDEGSRSLSKSLIFGELVKLAIPVLTHYHSDLFHDATWVAITLPATINKAGTVDFYYAVRPMATLIYKDDTYNMDHVLENYKEVWHILVYLDETHRLVMDLVNLKEFPNEEEA